MRLIDKEGRYNSSILLHQSQDNGRDGRRTEDGDGWCLRFANGAMLKLYDNGQASTVGKGANAIAQLLDVPVEPGNL